MTVFTRGKNVSAGLNDDKPSTFTRAGNIHRYEGETVVIVRVYDSEWVSIRWEDDRLNMVQLVRLAWLD